MKAAIRYKYGSPDRIILKDIAKPVPGDNEVIVKIYATTVNRTDCANLTAKPFIMHFVLGLFRPKKIILGTDFAGEVVEAGKNVEDFKVKDRVFGFRDTGLESQAEYIVIDPEKVPLQHIPENIDFKEAAASMEGAHYAYSFIHKTKIEPGQRGLINGASGAIGSALLQLLQEHEVHLSVTCDTKNIALMRSLGANSVYDYTREDFTKTAEKYDFIFDAVGKSTFGKCKPLLKKGGTYISSEAGPYAQNLFLAMSSGLMNKKVIFPVPFKTNRTLPYIKKQLEEGKLHPVIDREYPLSEIATAYRYVMSGKKTGNVAIKYK